MTWTSLHVFIHGGATATDRFLLEGLQPLTDRLVKDEQIDGWFFVRYWEGGPHVRLRLRAATPAGVDRARDGLAEYLRRAPAATTPVDPRAFYRGYTDLDDPVAHYGWHDDHSIADIAYQPETERYGGPAGLAISEDLFGDSSQIALALIRLAADRPRRVPAAIQLLFAMVEATDLPATEAVAWLRGNTAAWSQILRIPTAQIVETVTMAQGDYFGREQAWLAMRRPAAGGRPSLAATWGMRVRRAMTRYRAAHDAGQLGMTPEGIMWSQLHMLHNRAGLAILDECFIASLVTLALARSSERAAFAVDSIDAIDRKYHEHSKYSPHLLDEQRPGDVPPPDAPTDPASPWSRAAPVALPAPAPDPRIDGLAAALRARRSRHDGYRSLTAADLGTLLGLALGTGARPDRRTYPSGGARYPVQGYVLVMNVDGIPAGLYVYDPGRHALRWVSAAPDRDTVARCSPHLSSPEPGAAPGPIQARDAPAWVFPVADLTYQRRRYGMRSYRLVLLECGHLTQNLGLVGAALGLSSITIGAFFDDLLNQMLSLDGVNRSALYMIPFGRSSS